MSSAIRAGRGSGLVAVSWLTVTVSFDDYTITPCRLTYECATA
jgi:hypothetical protein